MMEQGNYEIPRGLTEIIDYYGPLPSRREERAAWESANLIQVPLPYALRLSWDPLKVSRSIRVHRKTQEQFHSMFQASVAVGWHKYIIENGGTHVWRAKRTKTGDWSTHAWGISIDLNPSQNPIGKHGEWDPDFVRFMETFGFYWGGFFTGLKDPMHFQLCVGY